MKRLLFIFIWVILMTMSCETPKSNTAQSYTTQQTYSSPVVYTAKSPVKALPADSIPTTYSIKGVAIAPADFASMMGRWVSIFDDKEVVHFAPGHYASFYNGEKIVEEKMTYYHVCPDNCDGGKELKKPCFVLASDYEQACFGILKNTDNELELTLLGGQGAALSYVRE